MERTMTSDLAEHAGEQVRLAGWVHHQRHLAQVSFLLLRDASGIGQVVIDDASQRAFATTLLPETVVEIEGTVVASPQAPGGFEVHGPAIAVLGTPADMPPFELRRPELNAQLPSLLDHAAVALRHPRIRAAFSISAASLAGFRSTLDGMGFTEIQTPKIVGAATESGANVFGSRLLRAPRLPRPEPAAVQADDGRRVRARLRDRAGVPRRAARHRAPPRRVRVARRRARVHSTTIAMSRSSCARCSPAWSQPSRSAPPTRSHCSVSSFRVPDEIPRIHFHDAQRLLEAATGERVVGEPDLAPAHERWLGEWALAEHGSEFLFVEGYPMAKRPFYTHPEPGRPEFSNSFDLLFRGLELVTGGQRLHRYDDYLEALDDARACRARRLPRGVPPRHAAARRLRHRPRAVDGARRRRAERPPGHVVPARHQPADAVARGLASARGTSGPTGGLRRAVSSHHERRSVGARLCAHDLSQSWGAVDLYWIPLGAGANVVRVSGKVFEAVSALAQRRGRCDLYHSALVVHVPSRFVIERCCSRSSPILIGSPGCARVEEQAFLRHRRAAVTRRSFAAATGAVFHPAVRRKIPAERARWLRPRSAGLEASPSSENGLRVHSFA